MRRHTLPLLLLPVMMVCGCNSHTERPPNPEELYSRGRQVYLEYCAECHQTDGSGCEYLIFANRFRGTTFDRNLPADGLAVYHVLQDDRPPAAPPFFLSLADWGRFTDWGHRAVRLLRGFAVS